MKTNLAISLLAMAIVPRSARRCRSGRRRARRCREGRGAKLITKFINNLAGTIDGDPAVRGRLKVLFLPD